MRVKIIPHGLLKDFLPLDFECEATTPYQALNALDRVHGLKQLRGIGRLKMQVVDHPTIAHLYSPLRVTELHVVPAFVGGGGGGGMGFLQILIGAALIAFTVITGGAGGLMVATFGATLGPMISGALFGMGLSLVLGGIASLISPSPVAKYKYHTPPGASFGTPANTTLTGTPIPIGYGTFALAGQIISLGLEADPSAPDNNPPSSNDRRLLHSPQHNFTYAAVNFGGSVQ